MFSREIYARSDANNLSQFIYSSAFFATDRTQNQQRNKFKFKSILEKAKNRRHNSQSRKAVFVYLLTRNVIGKKKSSEAE